LGSPQLCLRSTWNVHRVLGDGLSAAIIALIIVVDIFNVVNSDEHSQLMTKTVQEVIRSRVAKNAGVLQPINVPEETFDIVVLRSHVAHRLGNPSVHMKATMSSEDCQGPLRRVLVRYLTAECREVYSKSKKACFSYRAAAWQSVRRNV